MGIKDTVLGWLSSTPDKADELEDAEADELTREYSADRADTVAGLRARRRPRRLRPRPGSAPALAHELHRLFISSR